MDFLGCLWWKSLWVEVLGDILEMDIPELNRFDHLRDGVEYYKCNDEKEVAHDILIESVIRQPK